MILSIKWQVLIFFVSIFIGLSIGFFYDLIRVFRRIIKHKNIFVQIEDFLYWFFAAIYSFFIALYKNNGEIRFFFILGIFLGMTLYFCTISIIFIKISSIIINFIKKVFILTFKAIYIPLKTLVKVLTYPFNGIIKKFKISIKNVLHKSKTYAIIKNKLKDKEGELSEE